MAKFQVEGAIFDTEKAKANWPEASDWNGSNHISRATGDLLTFASNGDIEHIYIFEAGEWFHIPGMMFFEKNMLPLAEDLAATVRR